MKRGPYARTSVGVLRSGPLKHIPVQRAAHLPVPLDFRGRHAGVLRRPEDESHNLRLLKTGLINDLRLILRAPES